MSRRVAAYPHLWWLFHTFQVGNSAHLSTRMVGASGFSSISVPWPASVSAFCSSEQSRPFKDSDEERMSFSSRWLGSKNDEFTRIGSAQGPQSMWCPWGSGPAIWMFWILLRDESFSDLQFIGETVKAVEGVKICQCTFVFEKGSTGSMLSNVSPGSI